MYKLILSLLLSALCFACPAQNVGIGTNTPTFPLTVMAPAFKGIAQKTGTVEIGFYTTSTIAYLQTWSNHNLNFTTNNQGAQMTLTTAGNLGIGVIAPTAKLDVNGTVRIRGGNPAPGYVLTASDAFGNAEWKLSSASATKVLFISHPAFLPDRSAIGWITLDGTGRRPTTANAGSYKLQAPLLLPVGAVIKEITWYFDDWNASQNMTFALFQEISGIASVISSVTSTGSVSGQGTRTLSVPLNHTMTNNFYWLDVSIQNWPLDYTLLMHGARITYEY